MKLKRQFDSFSVGGEKITHFSPLRFFRKIKPKKNLKNLFHMAVAVQDQIQ